MIDRNIIMMIFPLLLFSSNIYTEAWGGEKDEVKQEIQELRQQMEVMQKRLEDLEERNRMLEEEAKKQREEKEIERAIGETAPKTGITGGLQRFIQTFNPDISVIGIFSAAYFSEDEPFVRTEADPENTGVDLQEIEIAFQGAIDPYFRFDSFFSIEREGIETEEAFATTLLTLPLNSQIRVGIMRSKFGRINLHHRHVQDFVTLPLPAASFLGEHLNPPGIEANFLLPLPWFAELSASVNSPEVETSTFDRDEDA
ncbi:MAG TPA: hypothetical protein VHT73_11720, partial [Thermodesulfobacteriota bacterium]|nr:hypothetical protein [Thermodesulfobacteriota bacterium]